MDEIKLMLRIVGAVLIVVASTILQAVISPAPIKMEPATEKSHRNTTRHPAGLHRQMEHYNATRAECHR